MSSCAAGVGLSVRRISAGDLSVSSIISSSSSALKATTGVRAGGEGCVAGDISGLICVDSASASMGKETSSGVCSSGVGRIVGGGVARRLRAAEARILGTTDAGRRPGFHAAAQRTEQIHLLVPDGREIDMHHMQVQSDQHDGSLCPCPAESVVQSLLAAHRIVDNIVSAEQHAVAKGALVELRACGPLYAHIAILRVDDMCRAQAGGLLYLEGMPRQNANLRLRSQGAYSLQRK